MKIHEGKEIITTTGNSTFKITSGGSEDIPALYCTHEEADGRLLYHASNAAAAGHNSVVICSEDTDVFIMAVTFHDVIGVPLFIKCGSRNRIRLVDVTRVASSLG